MGKTYQIIIEHYDETKIDALLEYILNFEQFLNVSLQKIENDEPDE